MANLHDIDQDPIADTDADERVLEGTIPLSDVLEDSVDEIDTNRGDITLNTGDHAYDLDKQRKLTI